MMENTALAPIEGKPVRSVNALLPIGVMLVGMVYGTLASGVEQHYLEVLRTLVVVLSTLVAVVRRGHDRGRDRLFRRLGKPPRCGVGVCQCVNAPLPIGVMLVGMVYGTLASGVEQHYLEVCYFVRFQVSMFCFFRVWDLRAD